MVSSDGWSEFTIGPINKLICMNWVYSATALDSIHRLTWLRLARSVAEWNGLEAVGAAGGVKTAVAYTKSIGVVVVAMRSATVVILLLLLLGKPLLLSATSSAMVASALPLLGQQVPAYRCCCCCRFQIVTAFVCIVWICLSGIAFVLFLLLQLLQFIFAYVVCKCFIAATV